MINQSLTIKSTFNTYDVLFVTQLQMLIDQLNSCQPAVIIIDKNVASSHFELVVQLKNTFPIYELEAIEEEKTLAGAEKLLKFFQENNVNKSTYVIAIGGGITQDVASFAAHLYFRGLKFIYVPTTLLAMGDSCIGAKCGLNFSGFKNQIGAFHPPEKVLIWTGFLNTLSDMDIYSGYGEIFKLLLIGNKMQLDNMQSTLSEFGFRNSSIDEHIYQALMIKKKFIEEDEFDQGVRRILNYGHTFGHSIELATNYTVPHGIAVALGMDIANFIAYRLGLQNKDVYQELHCFIIAHFDMMKLKDITAELLIANAKKDKKVSGGNSVNMVLLQKPEAYCLYSVHFDEDLKGILNEYLAGSVRVKQNVIND